MCESYDTVLLTSNINLHISFCCAFIFCDTQMLAETALLV